MHDGMLFLLLIVLGVAGIAGLRHRARRMVLMRHAPMELEKIHEIGAPAVRFSTFKSVYAALGAAYAIDPRTIRPQDSLRLFLDLDTWSLGMGTEKLEQWMASIGIQDLKQRPVTVLDLLMLADGQGYR